MLRVKSYLCHDHFTLVPELMRRIREKKKKGLQYYPDGIMGKAKRWKPKWPASIPAAESEHF